MRRAPQEKQKRYVDSTPRAATALYLCRCHLAADGVGTAGHYGNASGYFSEHQYSGGDDALELSGLFAGPKGKPDCDQERALADNDGERHRAYRVDVAERHRGDQ